MNKTIETAKFLLDTFKGREEWIAYKTDDSHFKPVQITKPITPEKFLESHLLGNTCLGFYLLTENNTCYVSCLDFDNHDHSNTQVQWQAIDCTKKLQELGYSPVLEVSQSGFGSHVWLLFDTEIPAWLVRKFWQTFLETQFPEYKPEIYPKQDELSGKKLGNLIRYPLYNKSKFIDVFGLDQDIEDLQDSSYKTRECDIRRFLESMEVDTKSPEESILTQSEASEAIFEGTIPERVQKLLEEGENTVIGARWLCQTYGLYDGSYSGILMSLATELVRAYVPTEDIRESLEYWCKLRDYQKPLERPELLDRTIEKAYDMLVDRREKKALSGNTFGQLAHSYADIVFRNEEIIIPTGIKGLDESFGGFGVGELSIFSGRPSQGKTAITLQCLDTAASFGYPSMLVSLEMSAAENSRRTLLRLSNGKQSEWKTEQGNRYLHEKITNHYKNRSPMYFIEGVYRIDEIEEAVEHYVKSYGVKMVALDYQGLATAGYRDEYSNQTEITKRLKKLSRMNDIAFISLVQMKRVQDDKPDREPQLSDLRSSGEIEQSADNVVFVRWPYKDDSSRSKNEYLSWIKKCRNREIKQTKVDLFFDSSIQTFR